MAVACVVTGQDFSQMVGDPSGRDIRGQMFDASGTAVGSEFLVNTTTTNNQLDPSVTGLAGGGFVVTWSDGSQTAGDTSSGGIRGQIFDASGTAVGSEFLVNTTTTNGQAEPSVTGLAGAAGSWSLGKTIVKRPGTHLTPPFAARSSTPAARQSAASSWSTRRPRASNLPRA